MPRLYYNPTHCNCHGESLDVDATSVWYLSYDEKIVGPLSAESARSFVVKMGVQARVLMTRKGFEQWYPFTVIESIIDKSLPHEKALIQAVRDHIDDALAEVGRVLT